MIRWKECSRGHMFGIQHSICSCASWHIAMKSYLQICYKRNCSIYELDTIPLNSLYPASWDSLFSIVCIRTFAQITDVVSGVQMSYFAISLVLCWIESKDTKPVFSYCLRSRRLSNLPVIQSLYKLKVLILSAVCKCHDHVGKGVFLTLLQLVLKC